MELDCLLLYIPKLKNYYKLFGNHMFGMFMPMGLFAIADLSARSGFKTQIVHFGVEKIEDKNFCINDYVAKTKPKIIGLALHWNFQSYDVIKIAQEIKSANQNIFIVIGGFTATFFHDEIMEEFSFIDGVIKGDGETPFLKLTEAITDEAKDLSSVPNLSWRRGNKIIKNEISYTASSKDLDELNFTNFSLLKNYELYIKYVKVPWFWISGLSKKFNLRLADENLLGSFPLSISRGCYVNCSYCGGSRASQKIMCNRQGVVFRSAEKVLESIEEAKNYGYYTIRIEYFPCEDAGYFEKLFNLIKAKALKLSCILECRALPAAHILELFRETFDLSQSQISFSPESGSEKIRKLNKGYYYDNSELLNAVNCSISLGIKTAVFFALGLPFETTDTVRITKDFQDHLRKEYNDLVIIRTEIIGLDPASPMYMEPEKYKIVKVWGSFMDYYDAHMGAKNFLKPILGYYAEALCKKRVTVKKLTEAQFFENGIRKIYCKNFCRLNNFLSRKFKIKNMGLSTMMFSVLSNLFCGFAKQLLKCKDYILKG